MHKKCQLFSRNTRSRDEHFISVATLSRFFPQLLCICDAPSQRLLLLHFCCNEKNLPVFSESFCYFILLKSGSFSFCVYCKYNHLKYYIRTCIRALDYYLKTHETRLRLWHFSLICVQFAHKSRIYLAILQRETWRNRVLPELCMRIFTDAFGYRQRKCSWIRGAHSLKHKKHTHTPVLEFTDRNYFANCSPLGVWLSLKHSGKPHAQENSTCVK